MAATDVSMRVVADHARASTFLIADGVVPSNEWRGYVLRKIMRRAMRHGRKLGMHEPFLYKIVDVIVQEMGEAYPELGAGKDAVKQVIKAEEERFDAVLTGGLPRLEDVLERAAKGNKVVPGDEAFKLYDSYGLPRDFIEDLAGNQGLSRARRAKTSRLPATRHAPNCSRSGTSSRAIPIRRSRASLSCRCSTRRRSPSTC
jgi:alanyl-tRNA synthetase